MGLWPSRGNENQRRRPRESGDPSSVQGIPAFSVMTRFSGENDGVALIQVFCAEELGYDFLNVLVLAIHAVIHASHIVV